MTLLISVFAAIICTIIWYINPQRKELYLGFLSLMYWGASLMWLVDAFFEYAELHEDYFLQAVEDMINDAYLGLSVIAIGLIIWLVLLLIKDPRGVIKNSVLKKT